MLKKDTANAPIVFRSTDTKLKEALGKSRSGGDQTWRERPSGIDPQVEDDDHSPSRLAGVRVVHADAPFWREPFSASQKKRECYSSSPGSHSIDRKPA